MSLTIAQLILDPAGVAYRPVVATASVMQADFSHDTAIIDIRNADTTAPYYVTGTPVLLNYGWVGQSDLFYGYVSHIEVNVRHGVANASTYTRVVCVGASYPLKQGLAAVYPNAQASYLAQQIATSAMLSGFIETDDPYWPQLSSVGMSTWDFLVAIAEKLGWTFSVNKTNMKFLSTGVAMAQTIASMPSFYTAATAGSLETISEFSTYQGEATPIDGHSKAQRIVSDIDPATGTTYTLVSGAFGGSLGLSNPSPLFTKYPIVINGQNSAVTSNALDGVASKNRFYLQAKARLAGNVSVLQGTPIYLSGLGPVNSGVWYVQFVSHIVTNNNYMIDVSLGRDGVGDNGIVPTQSPAILTSLGTRYALERNNIPSTILVGGIWRASTQGIQNV